MAAISALSKDQYDLFLMDCQMPHMDGFEATREIRRLEHQGWLTHQKGRLPIIALTAIAIEGDSKRCLATGTDGCARKPIDLKTLVATIESLRPNNGMAAEP